MIVITVLNKFGNAYAKALRSSRVTFLLEVGSEETTFTICSEDWNVVSKALEEARKTI